MDDCILAIILFLVRVHLVGIGDEITSDDTLLGLAGSASFYGVAHLLQFLAEEAVEAGLVELEVLGFVAVALPPILDLLDGNPTLLPLLGTLIGGNEFVVEDVASYPRP